MLAVLCGPRAFFYPTKKLSPQRFSGNTDVWCWRLCGSSDKHFGLIYQVSCDGRDVHAWINTANVSATATHYPTVLELNGDGRAELILVTKSYDRSTPTRDLPVDFTPPRKNHTHARSRSSDRFTCVFSSRWSVDATRTTQCGHLWTRRGARG
jgi:hypothetical protein